MANKNSQLLSGFVNDLATLIQVQSDIIGDPDEDNEQYKTEVSDFDRIIVTDVESGQRYQLTIKPLPPLTSTSTSTSTSESKED